MKRIGYSISVSMFLFLALMNAVWAQDETFTDKFLGSPLLILAIMIFVALIAMVFHKIRK